jgi:phospholipid/cholesterol/gamma-HCH transport system ATP-binding protein
MTSHLPGWTLSLGTAAHLIRQLNDTLGITSIVVSLEETFRIADKVIILGQRSGSRAELEVVHIHRPVGPPVVNALSEGLVSTPGPAWRQIWRCGAAAQRSRFVSGFSLSGWLGNIGLQRVRSWLKWVMPG